jgi:formylglycine-generating enzyme required for sulfatase activity
VVLPAAGGKGFLLGTYEITQAQYHAYITDAQVWPQVQKAWKAAVRDPETPLTLLPRLARSPDSATWQVHAGTALDQLASVDLPAGLAALPVTGISRTDAEGYCAWLSQRSGHQIRLPRREEWQAAAHGGDPMRIHPWGEVFDRTFPVCAMNVPTHKAEPCRPGSRPADTGPFGHRDLAGNVREWLGDRATPGSDLLLWHGALIAGGGYFDASPDVFRSTYVETLAPETPHGQLGFRILVEIP